MIFSISKSIKDLSEQFKIRRKLKNLKKIILKIVCLKMELRNWPNWHVIHLYKFSINYNTQRYIFMIIYWNWIPILISNWRDIKTKSLIKANVQDEIFYTLQDKNPYAFYARLTNRKEKRRKNSSVFDW